MANNGNGKAYNAKLISKLIDMLVTDGPLDRGAKRELEPEVFVYRDPDGSYELQHRGQHVANIRYTSSNA